MDPESRDIQYIEIEAEIKDPKVELKNEVLIEEDEDDYETVVLENVDLENRPLSKAVVIGSYTEDNSDGNFEISSEPEIVRTFIVRNADINSSESLDSIQEYIIESEESQDQIEDDSTVIEEYVAEMEDSDSLESEYEYISDKEDTKAGIDKNLILLEQVSEKPSCSENFPCTLCERTFKTSVGLKRHKSISHASKEVIEGDPLTLQICACCGEPLDLNTHTVGDYQCPQCMKSFPQKSILDRHTSLEHPKGDEYKCSECRFTCKERINFEQHLQTHSFKVVKCVCNKEFTRKYHLERHLQISGCGGEKREPLFKCQVCNKKFFRKDNLKIHMKVHQDGRRKENIPFQCTFCMKEFKTVSLLNIHIRTHTGERPFPCDVCPKRFPSGGALKKHFRMHTGEKPFQCSYCDRTFAARETLNRHVRIHTGDKPHSCKFCGKSFIQAAQLRAHIFYHTGENAYVCQYCSRAFNRKLRLTTHIKYIHEGAEPFHCTECKKTFFRKEDLARHSISHTNEKRFVCTECNKSFAVKSSLKIHKLTHRKEPPCRCEYCGVAFIRQDCLMRHMRNKHREILEDIMITAEKKHLQQQLLGAISAAESEQKNIVDSVIWNEFTLTESVKELLTLLVDEECLTELGYPDTPIDKVLDAVIKRCGHDPASEEDFDYIGRMRENAKLLFTVVIDDDAVKALLNNQTVDEVILHVLKLAKESS